MKQTDTRRFRISICNVIRCLEFNGKAFILLALTCFILTENVETNNVCVCLLTVDCLTRRKCELSNLFQQ